MKFSSVIVVLVIVLNVVFAAAVLYVFYHTASEPMTLVASWFAFTTGELWLLATIKKRKIDQGGDSHEE